MTDFLQICAAVLLAVILILMLGSGKGIGAILAMAVCSMAAVAALGYLRPVVYFLSQLERLGGLDHNMVQVLMKIVGIGLISEIASLVCSDSGNASMGKAMQLLGTAVILWLSLPLFSAFVELLQSILGEL